MAARREHNPVRPDEHRVLQDMASGIWEHVGGDGRAPGAALQAARDLSDLYISLNHCGTLGEIVGRFPDNVTGWDLAAFALTPGEPATMAVHVPSFEASVDEGELVWEGGDRPASNPARRHSSSCGCKHNPAADPRILLLEDEPMIAKGTTRMLGRVFPGVPVTVVDNVDEAIAHLKHHDVTLVVSDYDVLGDKTGGDLFRWVQANKPELVEHYVFFSGNEAAVEALGHHRFLPKPAGLAEFKAAVLGGPTPNPAATPRDVSEAVLEVLPAIRAEQDEDGRARERFGDRKVFVSAIWRSINEDPRLHGIDEEEFKQLLLLAHRERLLTLARADLVAAMNRYEVAESEIKADGATFHFVVDPNVRR